MGPSERAVVHMALEALTSLPALLPSGAGTWDKCSGGSSRTSVWVEGVDCRNEECKQAIAQLLQSCQFPSLVGRGEAGQLPLLGPQVSPFSAPVHAAARRGHALPAVPDCGAEEGWLRLDPLHCLPHRDLLGHQGPALGPRGESLGSRGLWRGERRGPSWALLESGDWKTTAHRPNPTQSTTVFVQLVKQECFLHFLNG